MDLQKTHIFLWMAYKEQLAKQDIERQILNEGSFVTKKEEYDFTKILKRIWFDF